MAQNKTPSVAELLAAQDAEDFSYSIYNAQHNRLATLNPATIFWIHERQPNFQPGLYVSLHRTALPPVQGNRPWRDNPELPSPWSYYYPRMVTKADFWSSLVPAKWAYEGLLQPLARIETLQVSGSKGIEYRLANLKAWQGLEEDLRSFEIHLDREGAWTKLDVEFTPWPSDYGYDGAFKSETVLKKEMKKIRGVFMLVVARLTYMVFLLRKRKNPWLEALTFGRRITFPFYQRVLQSPIYQEVYERAGSFERVGMIIDVTLLQDQEWASELQAIVEHFSMPIWMYYGEAPENAAVHDWAWHHLPSTSRVTLCKTIPDVCGISLLVTNTPGEEWQPVQVDDAAGWDDVIIPQSTYAPGIARPDDITRQFPGQTWQEFMAAEEQWKKEKASQETDDQRAVRLRREATELAKPWPTRSSKCRIFVWEEDIEGVWIRTFRSNVHGRDIWQSTAPSQRRYNSFRNEWDVCTEFDPTGRSLEDELDEEWSGYDNEHQEMPSGGIVRDSLPESVPTPRAMSKSPSPSFFMEPRLSDAYARCPTPRPYRSPEPRRPMQVPMASRRSRSPRCRTPPRRLRTPRPRSEHAAAESSSAAETATIPPVPGAEETATSSLAPADETEAMETDVPADDESEETRAQGLVLGLPLATALWQRYGIAPTTEGYHTPEAIVKTRLDDLKVRKIIAHSNETFSPEIVVFATDFICALSFKVLDARDPPLLPACVSDMMPGNPRGYPRHQQGLAMVVRPCLTPEGEPWYVLTSATLEHGKDVSWLLGVQDPLTVNQILRENRGPSVFHVCEHLLENGIRFKTLAAHPNPFSWLWAPRPMPLFYKDIPLALGARVGRNFTMEDYDAYVVQRDAILKSHRGRAAFLRGGIVWRLARECTSYEDALLGPSGTETQADYINLDGMGFVDDELSEHELAVICGVYRVLPVQSQLAGRASFDSWWPSEATWKECGHSVGYWTPNCEHWFQKRLSGILSGKEGPKAPAAWRTSLKHMKARTGTLLKNARAIAAQSLPRTLP